MGTGDELVITLQGQVSRSIRTRVDTEGRVVIPDIPPIPAVGRPFGDFRRDLEREVAATFLNTSVFASIGAVRNITVAVLGEVPSPGIFHIGGLASVLDAMKLSGGILKTGSLRRITLTRGNRTINIDLYGAITDVHPAPDLALADGDRIMVPPIGPTAAVADEVVRPGIYELPAIGPD